MLNITELMTDEFFFFFLAYYYITWGTWLRHCLAGRSDKYALVWPRLLTSVPYLKMIEEDQDQDQAKKSQ